MELNEIFNTKRDFPQAISVINLNICANQHGPCPWWSDFSCSFIYHFLLSELSINNGSSEYHRGENKLEILLAFPASMSAPEYRVDLTLHFPGVSWGRAALWLTDKTNTLPFSSLTTETSGPETWTGRISSLLHSHFLSAVKAKLGHED